MLIVTDNGTIFCSREFQEFLQQNSVNHIITAPYHPSSNGAAENAAKTANMALKKDLG